MAKLTSEYQEVSRKELNGCSQAPKAGEEREKEGQERVEVRGGQGMRMQVCSVWCAVRKSPQETHFHDSRNNPTSDEGEWSAAAVYSSFMCSVKYVGVHCSRSM